MVALDYFRRLGHDNHRRLSKRYVWEEKKSKASWGGETVDYGKLATAAVKSMKPADLNRFLVVCALVSDLYCPGQSEATAREKLKPRADGVSLQARLSKDSPCSPNGTVSQGLSRRSTTTQDIGR
jgi:hypothetical protein